MAVHDQGVQSRDKTVTRTVGPPRGSGCRCRSAATVQSPASRGRWAGSGRQSFRSSTGWIETLGDRIGWKTKNTWSFAMVAVPGPAHAHIIEAIQEVDVVLVGESLEPF